MLYNWLWSNWPENRVGLIYTREKYIDQKRNIHFYRCFKQSRYYISIIYDKSQVV